VIPIDFWKDRVLLSLPAQTFKVCVYLLCGPHSNALGSFYLPIAYICDDLHLLRKTVVKAITHLDRISFVRYDWDTRYALILSLRSSGSLLNPNGWKCAIRELSEMPDSVPWKQELSAQLTEIKRQQDNADGSPLPMPNGRQPNNGEGEGEGDRNGNRDRDRNAQSAEGPAAPANALPVSDSLSLPKSFSFPLKGGSSFVIGEAEVDHLQKLFSNIVVPVRLKHHQGWFSKNPHKLMDKDKTSILIYKMLSEDSAAEEKRATKQ